MKGVKLVKINKEEAQKHWEEYRRALKEDRAGGYIREYYQLKRLYGAIRLGKKVIDIRDCWKKAGWNEKWQPRLAIASLYGHRKEVTLEREKTGELIYEDSRGGYSSAGKVCIPKGVMTEIPKDERDKHRWGLPRLKGVIPIIPPKYLPKASKRLKDYYVMWEVKDWKEIPKDPLLLKRVSSFAFIVLAAWDLTPIERMVLG